MISFGDSEMNELNNNILELREPLGDLCQRAGNFHQYYLEYRAAKRDYDRLKHILGDLKKREVVSIQEQTEFINLVSRTTDKYERAEKKILQILAILKQKAEFLYK